MKQRQQQPSMSIDSMYIYVYNNNNNNNNVQEKGIYAFGIYWYSLYQLPTDTFFHSIYWYILGVI